MMIKMKKCINCGKVLEESEGHLIAEGNILVSLFNYEKLYLCDRCEKVGQAMEKALKEGIEIEYTDGTKEIIKKK